MRLSIDTSGVGCPPGTPVALVDLDSGERLGCYASVGDAQHHKAAFEAAERGHDEDCTDPDCMDPDCDPDDDDDEFEDDCDEYQRGYNAGYALAIADVNRVLRAVRSSYEDDEPDDDSEFVAPEDDDDPDADAEWPLDDDDLAWQDAARATSHSVPLAHAW